MRSLYWARAGTETNLHCDEHSGFLALQRGTKRVLLFPPKAKALRGSGWGDAAAPTGRRSWHHGRLLLGEAWAADPRFAGLGGTEVRLS